MDDLSQQERHIKKGENVLNLLTYQTWALVLSTALLILAITSAYPLYIEGKIAQKNARDLMYKMERVVLQTEITEPQHIIEISEPEEMIKLEVIKFVSVSELNVE